LSQTEGNLCPGQQVPGTLLDFIRDGRKFLIVGHKEPDGDCLGSQLALASILRRMDKEALLCSAGPFKRTEIKDLQPLFTSTPVIEGAEYVIVVDCSTLDRTGDMESCLKGLPMAVIDHHGAGETRTNSAIGPCYIDVKAPSTTFMVVKLIEALGLELNKEEAEFLFFGLCTDTGFFRHVDGNGAGTFEVAASLIRCGANPKVAYLAIYGGKSLDSRRLMGHVLIKTESFFDGKLVMGFEEYEETCRFGLEGRDSDSLYQLLQSVAGVEAIVIIRQETHENCTVGLRSRFCVDVGRIAANFGGGGHMNAAGFSAIGSIAELKQKLILAFKDVL
jgi:phosphoesterase RecJ-like protein